MTLRGPWAWIILIVLFLSLGLNFFMAGFMAERWRTGMGFGGPGGPGGSMMAGYLRDFPPELRRAIGRQLFEERRQLMGSLADFGEKRRAVLDAMRAPNLDVAEVRRRMGEVRALTTRLQERAQELTIEALRAMPAEERARIGERRWRHRGE